MSRLKSQATNNSNNSNQVLVVDDEKDIGFLLKMLLGVEGYEVHYAENLTTAREALREQHFHTIFLDLNLENEFGLDLVPEIRSLNYEASIVVITAQKAPSVLKSVEESKVDHLIEKPFDKQKILSVINSPH